MILYGFVEDGGPGSRKIRKLVLSVIAYNVGVYPNKSKFVIIICFTGCRVNMFMRAILATIRCLAGYIIFGRRKERTEKV